MLTQENLKSLFHYCPSKGEFTLLINHGKNKPGLYVGNKKTCNRTAYRQVKINGSLYLLHRLAFLYMKGFIPKVIDHLDGDGENNKWNNLIAANHIINGKNRPRNSNNTTGICGVSYHKKRRYFVAYIKHNYKQIELGRFSNLFDAAAARKSAEKKLGFNINHGR